jgi:hypothetical protein
VGCHEDASTTLVVRALTTKTSNLSIVVNLVVFQDWQLDLLLAVLVLLWSSVVLLLALLRSTTKAKN